MAEAPTSLTTPLDVKVSEQQLATLLREAPTTVPSLLIVREIQPGESGATLHFQQGNYGHLALNDPNYATYLRMARQSQERQHPLGVAFGEDAAILRLIRADNDVPGQLADESPGRTRVLFQGHDGTFVLQRDHPEYARIRALLETAIRQNARVWFLAQKPDLALLDALPAGWPVATFQISFVVAPDHLLRTADEILRSEIRCSKALQREVRAVAKAYIDEADELKRAVRDIETKAARVQIEPRSPPDMIEKAKRLQTLRLPNKEMQEKVRAVANSYVILAEKNQQLVDEFKEKYRNMLPPEK